MESYGFNLNKWFDAHTHLRQDELLKPVILDHIKSGVASILAMPNTLPPINTVLDKDIKDFKYQSSIENYKNQILNITNQFENIIIPLYLTADTTPEMIKQGAQSGLLKSCKYYPPKGTTNSNYSQSLEYFIENGVFKALSDFNIILNIHGESEDLENTDYFDKNRNAEIDFYQNRLPNLINTYPGLKIVCEHITTQKAVETVKYYKNTKNINISATITPQHLLYTIGDLLKGCQYHLYCLPLLKYSQDRAALRSAVIDPNNNCFFAGTDSAPHTQKALDCGCAAGCYTAPVALSLYAQCFELSGCKLDNLSNQNIFKKFIFELGSKFYNLNISKDMIKLTKQKTKINQTQIKNNKNKTKNLIPLPLGIGEDTVEWVVESVEGI